MKEPREQRATLVAQEGQAPGKSNILTGPAAVLLLGVCVLTGTASPQGEGGLLGLDIDL